MESPCNHRQEFSDLVGKLGEELDLALAALYIAAEDNPSIDIDGSLNHLDQMAHEVSTSLKADSPLADQLNHLSLYLGVKEGFHGNKDDYYNPDNSYFDRVLKNRTGIPITLSLVYMEVGARLGFTLEPIGLPGHVILRCGPSNRPIFIDPYHRGKILLIEDCEALVAEIFGRPVELTDDHFHPITRRQFLIRLLSNLKSTYIQRNDYQKALASADRICLVDPNQPDNLKQRAWLFRQMGQFSRAISDLRNYLKLRPTPEDSKKIEAEIASLWTTIASLN